MHKVSFSSVLNHFHSLYECLSVTTIPSVGPNLGFKRTEVSGLGKIMWYEEWGLLVLLSF